MPVQLLGNRIAFPDPRNAEPDGLVACGGDLTPDWLVAAYSNGIFPWYAEGPVFWYSPDPRMVLVPDRLRVNRTLDKTLRRRGFEIRVDTAFERVIRACADMPRPDQDGTWISPWIIAAYCALFERGIAHSVEAWEAGELVGGIYGVSLGAAFFGESMFCVNSNASKVALVRLIQQLALWGYHFLDCQVPSEHMARLGAEEWPRERFLESLARALAQPTRPGPWRFDVLSCAS